MEELKRKDGESDFEFHKRIINGKLVDKTLNDMDYSELSAYAYGKEYSSDVARRMFYGSRNTLELLDKDMIDNISDNQVLKEIEIKTRELQKERIKLSTSKLEYNKWLREDTRLEMLFSNMKKSIEKVDVPNFKTIIVDKNNKEGLLGISDFHFGKLFISINNKYSEDIFYERMNKLASEVVELCKENHISHLHVLNCGDDVEGMTLRISQLMSLQFGFSDQVIKLAKYMAKFLNKLSEDLEVTYHHVLSGNHSEIRAFGDKSFTLENMERIIITYTHDVLENNPRIHIPIYNGKYASFKIFEYNIYAQHGQKVKNPKRVIADVSQQHRIWFDVAYFGHLHHDVQMTTNEAPTHDCEVVYVPSIMGSDEYSDDNFFGGAKASAKLDIYEKGKCRKGSFKIILN